MPLPPSAACAHKIALSLRGFGYSSRLRSLLLCGSAVVHVGHDDDANEFFFPLLRDGEEIVVLRGRDAVRSKLLPALEQLRRDEPRAARVAAAGRAFAQKWLDFEAVVGYTASLLEAYAARFRANPVTVPPGFTRVRSAAELLRLTGMCDCRGGRAGRANAKPCLRETRGEKCTLWPPRGGGTCVDTRCCVGWDCALSPLGCR